MEWGSVPWASPRLLWCAQWAWGRGGWDSSGAGSEQPRAEPGRVRGASAPTKLPSHFCSQASISFTPLPDDSKAVSASAMRPCRSACMPPHQASCPLLLAGPPSLQMNLAGYAPFLCGSCSCSSWSCCCQSCLLPFSLLPMHPRERGSRLSPRCPCLCPCLSPAPVACSRVPFAPGCSAGPSCISLVALTLPAGSSLPVLPSCCPGSCLPALETQPWVEPLGPPVASPHLVHVDLAVLGAGRCLVVAVSVLARPRGSGGCGWGCWQWFFSSLQPAAFHWLATQGLPTALASSFCMPGLSCCPNCSCFSSVSSPFLCLLPGLWCGHKQTKPGVIQPLSRVRQSTAQPSSGGRDSPNPFQLPELCAGVPNTVSGLQLLLTVPSQGSRSLPGHLQLRSSTPQVHTRAAVPMCCCPEACGPWQDRGSGGTRLSRLWHLVGK